ncbi:MAG: 3'(2'),5'-bisphosphate nucleotidase CysQ [Pseudolabrys sp.]
MPASDPSKLLQPLEAVMREAGSLARDVAQKPFKHWTKGPEKSPVTEGDIAVNELLRARLPQLAPEAGWVSEENELSGALRPSNWVVDPIDGTRGFLAGKPDWTISVALVADGRPLIAALYAPETDEMFLSARGGGATLNGSRLSVSAGAALGGARLAGPKRYLERLSQFEPAVEPQPKVHSLALRMARVAQGALEAAFSSGGSHDWDLAAADLLVHEAGGVMTDFAGRPLSYNQPHGVHGALVAAGSDRHDALIGLVRDRQAEFA